MPAEPHGSIDDERTLVSVVIPVFDTEPFLDECLASVCGQSHDNLDIIIVDDGSTDGSSEICAEYARLDRRITLLRQPNRGVSAARNAGLDAATGDYIAFVDGDDMVGPHHVKGLLDVLRRTEADIVISGSTRRAGELSLTVPVDVEVYSPDELLLSRHPLSPLPTPSLWAKLYTRDVLSGVAFPEGRVHEDAMLTHRIVLRAQRVAVTTHSSYFYRLREESITGGSRAARYFLDKARAHQVRVEDLHRLYGPQLVRVEFSKALSSTLLAIDSLAGGTPEEDPGAAADASSLRRWLWENRRHQGAAKSLVALFGLRWAPSTTARLYARTVPELRRRP